VPLHGSGSNAGGKTRPLPYMRWVHRSGSTTRADRRAGFALPSGPLSGNRPGLGLESLIRATRASPFFVVHIPFANPTPSPEESAPADVALLQVLGQCLNQVLHVEIVRLHAKLGKSQDWGCVSPPKVGQHNLPFLFFAMPGRKSKPIWRNTQFPRPSTRPRRVPACKCWSSPSRNTSRSRPPRSRPPAGLP